VETQEVGNQHLLKSFYGDIPLKHGSLKIENQEVFGIKGKRLRLLRKDIGIIFQDYKLVNEFTIEENIMIPLKINGYSHEVSRDQANKLVSSCKT
jgi:cell division transport system ATP-binding protein